MGSKEGHCSLSGHCWINKIAQIYAQIHYFTPRVISHAVYLWRRQGQRDRQSPNKHQHEGRQGNRGALQALISICQGWCVGLGHILLVDGCFVNSFLTFTNPT